MRKQYHLQPSANGFYAWDVDKLVQLAKNLPVISVSLEDIAELDEPFWYQGTDSKPTCRSVVEHMRLIEQTDLSYPIILSHTGRVMDGMHRVGKALLLGQSEIKAVRFSQEIKPDYVDVQEDELNYDQVGP
jgi:ATP sulfurylase